jgi:hypothetical protein
VSPTHDGGTQHPARRTGPTFVQFALIAILICVAAAAALWQVADPGPIQGAVFIYETLPDAPPSRPFEQIAIQGDGHYKDEGAVRFDVDLGQIEVGDLLNALRSRTAARVSLPAKSLCNDCIFFSVVGPRRILRLAIAQDLGGSAAVALAVRARVHADVARRQVPVRAELRSLEHLSAIQFDPLGCDSCGVYHATFTQSVSTLEWRDPRGPVRNHRGVVNWERLKSALRAAGVDRLQHFYPSSSIDGGGVQLQFQFIHSSFGVEAHDMMMWPPEVRDTYNAILDVAAAGRWTPRLDENERHHGLREYRI